MRPFSSKGGNASSISNSNASSVVRPIGCTACKSECCMRLSSKKAVGAYFFGESFSVSWTSGFGGEGGLLFDFPYRAWSNLFELVSHYTMEKRIGYIRPILIRITLCLMVLCNYHLHRDKKCCRLEKVERSVKGRVWKEPLSSHWPISFDIITPFRSTIDAPLHPFPKFNTSMALRTSIIRVSSLISSPCSRSCHLRRLALSPHRYDAGLPRSFSVSWRCMCFWTQTVPFSSDIAYTSSSATKVLL